MVTVTNTSFAAQSHTDATHFYYKIPQHVAPLQKKHWKHFFSMAQVDKYLLLHHRQPLACRFCRDAPHAPYAIHYHWVFARHTGSPVPCLRRMVNHKVKDILSLKPNLCFPSSQTGIIGRYSECFGSFCVQTSSCWETKVWFSQWKTPRNIQNT